MISEKEALEMIQWGKTQGYSEQQSIELVNRRDHELKVRAQKARIKKQQEEQAEKNKLEAEQNQIDVDTKKRVYTHGVKIENGKNVGREYTLENGVWMFRNEKEGNKKMPVKDVNPNMVDELNEKYAGDDKSNITDYDKIISPSATWTDSEGNKKKLKDNILDYRDDDFVANTLTREYGEDFVFADSGSDMVTVTHKETGEEYEFETNFFWGSGEAEVNSGKGLIKFMKDQKFGDMSVKSNADYKAIPNDDKEFTDKVDQNYTYTEDHSKRINHTRGTIEADLKGGGNWEKIGVPNELEWHYVDPKTGEDLGVIESTSVTGGLNEKYKESLNEFKKQSDGVNDFKILPSNVDGENDQRDYAWHVRNEEGEFVLAPSEIRLEMDAIHGPANDKEEDGLIYNHGEVPLKAIVNKKAIEDENEKRSNMTREQYYNEVWYPHNFDKGLSIKNVMQNAKFLIDFKEGNVFSRDGSNDQVVKEDFEIYKNQSQLVLDNFNNITEKDIKSKDNTQEKISAQVNLLKEEYSNVETTSERKEELKSKILETQPEWSKFYDDNDFEGWDGLDLNDFNEFVKTHPSFKQLDVTTYGVTREEGEEGDLFVSGEGSAELKWDDTKQKYFWSGGVEETDFQKIDELKAGVLTEYLSSKISNNMEMHDVYEQAGTFDQLRLLDEYAENVTNISDELDPLALEYEALKKDIDDGVLESNEENISKLNNLGETINSANELINFNVDNYNKIANDEANVVLFDGYKDLANRQATLSKNFTTLIDPNGTSKMNKIAFSNYNERLDEQSRLVKAENGHLGWQAASIGESVWTSFIGGMSGIAGLAEAYVPELWSDTDAKTKSQIMNKYSSTAEVLSWNAVADGNMIDPETGDLNWSAVPSSVAPVVLDMYLMAQSGGTLGAAKTTVTQVTGKVLKNISKRVGLSATTLPKFTSTVSSVNRRIGKISTKMDLATRGNQFSGGMMIMLPKNIQESISQVDEDFTYEDALNSAFYKTVTESAIEMINPDIRFLKGMQKFKGTKGFGNSRMWNPTLKGTLDNGKKMLNIFGQQLKQLPSEMLEENLQEAANMMWNGYYNQKKNTEFHIPTSADFKALNVLTPISVLTAGFIRTRGFRKAQPTSSMYQAAVENYDDFTAQMKEEVETFRQTDGKRGLDPNDFTKIMADVDGYVAIKNKIDVDEYNEMTIGERSDMLGLMYTQEQKEKEIREEQNPKKKAELEKDLDNVRLDIQKVANSITTGVTTREQDSLEIDILMKKQKLLNTELGSDARVKLRKEIAKDLKKRNELREEADAFSFNGKSYNSSADFIEAIKTAKKNGYFDNPKNRPRIRIGNKVEASQAEYVSNMVESLTGVNNYKSGEVLMKSSDAQEADEYNSKRENQGKTIADYEQELEQENDNKSPDVNKLNDLRNVIKYLELKGRGYQDSKIGGGMVIRGRENKAVRDLAEQQMQDRIDAVKKIGEEGGVRTVVMSADMIKSQEGKNGPFGKGAHKANAMIVEQINPETGKVEQVMVVNSTVAMNSKSFSAVSHELLHVLLFTALNGPTRVVDGVNVRITEKGVKLIKGFLDLLPLSQKRKLEDELKRRGYKHGENKDGSINLNEPLPFEAYAEEYLNHYHDLVVNETDPNRRIPQNDPDTRGTIKKIGDYLKGFWQQETNEDMAGVMDGNLDTPKQVLEFLRNFNKQAIENKFDKELVQRAMDSQQFYGDIAQEEDETITQYSKTEKEIDNSTTQQEKQELADEVNSIYNAAELNDVQKEFMIAEKYRGMAEARFNIAYNEAPQSGKEMLLQNKEDIISDILFDTGTETAKARTVVGLVRDFETKKQKYGNTAAYINTFFKVRAYEIFSKYTKDKGFKRSMEDSVNEISQMESQTTEDSNNRGLQSGQVLVSERILQDDPYNEGKKERVNNYIQNIQTQVKENSNVYESKTYKTLNDLNPRGTVSIMMFDPAAVYKDDGTPFWQSNRGKKLVGTSILDSIIKKLQNNDNLNQQDIKSIQPYLSKHNQMLWTALPQGFMTDKNGKPTTATGVQNVLLEPFYNKGRRKGNLYPQYKKPDMPNDFLEVFGITPRGEVNLTGKETNVSQRVKALISQHGKILTNQSVRQELFTNGADPKVINNIANGRSIMVYAKNVVQGDVNPKTNEIEPGFANQEAQRVSEIIRMYHTDRKSFDFLKELDPIFVGVVEEMFIYPNPNLGQGLNYIPSIMLDKYTPKSFLKENFEGKSYKGPSLMDGKNPGEYQAKYVEEAVALGSTFHPDFDLKTLIYLLGFKDGGKSINPKLYKDQISQVKDRKPTPAEVELEEKFMRDNGIVVEDIKNLVPMIMTTTKIRNMINDIAIQKGLKAKKAKLEEYKSQLIKINKANEMAMKYVSLKMKQAYNDSKIISNHFVYFIGQAQTNIIEGTRALSTFEYMYLTEKQQVPLLKNGKLFKKPSRPDVGKNLTKQYTEKGDVIVEQLDLTNFEYYNSDQWSEYVKAYEKVGEWQERYKVNKNEIENGLKSKDLKAKAKAEKAIEKAGSKKAAIEVATINDLNWKNEHVGASATTHAERSSYVWSNGKSVDLANLGHDHRSAWVPKYLADKYFDAKITIGGKEVDNKTSYEGPMRMTKFGKGKSANIFHVYGQELVPYLTKVEGISKIVQEIRELSEVQLKNHQVLSKAVNNANKTNHKTPSRGMSAFDFDETLIYKGENTIVAKKRVNESERKEIIQNEADRLSRLTYQDYSDIGGSKAPNTDIYGYRSAWSIVNESTSEYESKKRNWKNKYKEKKQLREKKSEEFLNSYNESVAKVDEYIEEESRLTYTDFENIGKAPNTDIYGYRSAWSIVNESTSEYESNLRAWQSKKNEITESRKRKALESVEDQDFFKTKKEIEEDTSALVKTVTISSEQWPLQGPELAAEGYLFDFSDFINVRGGVEGPLMQKFRNRIEKFGIENNYILTARPAEAAPAIQAWLKEQGIDMPIENITGLGNSTGEAKAMWMAQKFSEGYNDMYFVDDAMPNVKAVADMLDQLDIKGSSVQAKMQFSRDISPTFSKTLDANAGVELDLNRILEQTKGVKAEARYSEAQGKIQGSKKGRFAFWVPPSAEDFKGLIYRFVGKGRQGEAQLAFFKKALFDPFGRGTNAMNVSKQQLQGQYQTLLKEFPNVKKDLSKSISSFDGEFDIDFKVEQAVRVYLWNKNGMEVPGLSARDLKALVEFVESDTELKVFADNLGLITNQEEGYVQPNDFWLVEGILSDIQKINNELSRAEQLAEFVQNKEEMFGVWENGRIVGPNMNKIEAIYGSNFREALEDILWRMEFGSKREAGTNRLVNTFNNWANQSVGAIMFLNMRSALLQTISSINYLNWSDNNPLKAGLALANFPQFIKDFSMIFNSDMLKQRRAGNQRGVNETELAQAVAGSKNKAKAILNYLLTKGFLPTQIADSFAIASGGATFYRNRVNSLMKQGLSQSEAEVRAFQDFAETTEESQQSSRPDMISQQQASPLGRYILAFKNTPMQYARLMKKAFLDIKNRRGDFKTNMGKIIYYGMVQNFIFSALQSALGAMIGGDEDEEKETKAYERTINSMIDSILGGIGLAGNIVMTIKNTIMEYNKQEKKGWNADHTYTILKFFGLSPTVGSKGRKLYSAIQTRKFNKDVMEEMSLLDIDNPTWSVIANLVSAGTNLPLDRLIKKIDNVDAALTEDISAMQRFALLMGWNTWDLGVEDQDIVAVEDEIKEKKKVKKEEQKKINKEKKKKEVELEEEKLIEDNIEKQKTETGEIKCAAINKAGKRCGTKIEPGQSFCTIHVKVDQGTKEVQCKKVKSDKKRCKMKTKAKSGLCYYHD